jgi:N-carbamoylputrescine amidase
VKNSSTLAVVHAATPAPKKSVSSVQIARRQLSRAACCLTKECYPSEDGWQEAAWFQSARPGFDVHDIAGVRVGFLVCTELMFNEHARALGRAGAQLIATPRATASRVDSWEVAARMAALVGGCYAASSNRRGHAPGAAGPDFGGHGFVVAPAGILIQHTRRDATSLVAALDLELAQAAKQAYPCYVQDLPITPPRSSRPMRRKNT